MRGFGVTDVGQRRTVNQDSFIIKQTADDRLLAVVCDGMGGAAGGLVASSTAAGTFAAFAEAELEKLGDGAPLKAQKAERLLRRAVDAANEAVYERAKENEMLTGMGTTLVAALVYGGDIYAVNVGDSRLYLISGDGNITQVTHDHSYVQFLVDIGKISEDEARLSTNRNIITRAVGTSPEIECDFFTICTDGMERACMLLCTDGLSNMLSADEIADSMIGDLTDENGLASACRTLVDTANENGGPDNITALLISL